MPICIHVFSVTFLVSIPVSVNNNNCRFGLAFFCLLMFGCSKVEPIPVQTDQTPFVEDNIGEIQSGYIKSMRELESAVDAAVALRASITDIWDFSIEVERTEQMQAALKFFHENDQAARLYTLQQKRERIRETLTALGGQRQSTIARDWARDSSELFGKFVRLLEGAEDLYGQTRDSWVQETGTLHDEFRADLAAFRLILEAPIQ